MICVNKLEHTRKCSKEHKHNPHVGGNQWAGGTGGRDTAGLGGKGGPYRLDAGHQVHQVPDYEKDQVKTTIEVHSFHILNRFLSM